MIIKKKQRRFAGGNRAPMRLRPGFFKANSFRSRENSEASVVGLGDDDGSRKQPRGIGSGPLAAIDPGGGRIGDPSAPPSSNGTAMTTADFRTPTSSGSSQTATASVSSHGNISPAADPGCRPPLCGPSGTPAGFYNRERDSRPQAPRWGWKRGGSSGGESGARIAPPPPAEIVYVATGEEAWRGQGGGDGIREPLESGGGGGSGIGRLLLTETQLGQVESGRECSSVDLACRRPLSCDGGGGGFGGGGGGGRRPVYSNRSSYAPSSCSSQRHHVPPSVSSVSSLQPNAHKGWHEAEDDDEEEEEDDEDEDEEDEEGEVEDAEAERRNHQEEKRKKEKRGAIWGALESTSLTSIPAPKKAAVPVKKGAEEVVSARLSSGSTGIASATSTRGRSARAATTGAMLTTATSSSVTEPKKTVPRSKAPDRVGSGSVLLGATRPQSKSAAAAEEEEEAKKGGGEGNWWTPPPSAEGVWIGTTLFAQAMSAFSAATSSAEPPRAETSPTTPSNEGVSKSLSSGGGGGAEGGGGGEAEGGGGGGVARADDENSDGSGGRKNGARLGVSTPAGGRRETRGQCMLLDSPFFCKENGMEEMKVVLENKDMRAGFKQASDHYYFSHEFSWCHVL